MKRTETRFEIWGRETFTSRVRLLSEDVDKRSAEIIIAMVRRKGGDGEMFPKG